MDQPPLTWKVSAIVLWASAMVGWVVAMITLDAYDRLKARRPLPATVDTPFPRS